MFDRLTGGSRQPNIKPMRILNRRLADTARRGVQQQILATMDSEALERHVRSAPAREQGCRGLKGKRLWLHRHKPAVGPGSARQAAAPSNAKYGAAYEELSYLCSTIHNGACHISAGRTHPRITGILTENDKHVPKIKPDRMHLKLNDPALQFRPKRQLSFDAQICHGAALGELECDWSLEKGCTSDKARDGDAAVAHKHLRLRRGAQLQPADPAALVPHAAGTQLLCEASQGACSGRDSHAAKRQKRELNASCAPQAPEASLPTRPDAIASRGSRSDHPQRERVGRPGLRLHGHESCGNALKSIATEANDDVWLA